MPAAAQEKAPSAAAPAKSQPVHPLAQYEAMRKAAQEESRKMYERMRRQMSGPWGGSQGGNPYYGNPYYGNPYQPRGN